MLGEDHPWFFFTVNGKARMAVGLTTAQNVDDWVDIKLNDLGNWSRIRLIAEVLPDKPPTKRKKTKDGIRSSRSR